MILPLNVAAGVHIGQLARCWIELTPNELTPVHVGDVLLLACTAAPLGVLVQIMILHSG